MSLTKEQVRHNRINLSRFVQRLEDVISDEHWMDSKGEQAWVKAQGMAQKIKYARQLRLDVDYQELVPKTPVPTSSLQRYLQNLQETLDRLDKTVDTLIQRLAPEPDPPSSYLSIMPLPVTVHEIPASKPQMTESSLEAPIPSYTDLTSQRHLPSMSLPVDPARDLLPSPSAPSAPISLDYPRASTSPRLRDTSSLLSASFQTHEELSNELSRMAMQLKRNAQHFSDSLDKDKSLLDSASEALEINHTTMTKERVRLKNHTGKSSGTTWMVLGMLVAVSAAWIFMFFVIRFT